MGKKIIQVPVEEGLLKKLNYLSQKQSKARAEIIREACQRYLVTIENEDMERLQKEGYERIPESPEIGEAQEAMINEVISKESW